MGLLGLIRVHLSRKLPLAMHSSQCRPSSGGETRRRRRRAGGGWDYEPEGQRTTRRGDMVGAAAAAEATVPDAAELSSFPVDTKTWKHCLGPLLEELSPGRILCLPYDDSFRMSPTRSKTASRSNQLIRIATKGGPVSTQTMASGRIVSTIDA
ncbi:hypothetical protein BHM03_00019059 [Ensete ventricosum]|nr:hypothetical protein BHM03_00019059 [Ensete ventricosum]